MNKVGERKENGVDVFKLKVSREYANLSPDFAAKYRNMERNPLWNTSLKLAVTYKWGKLI